MRMRKAFFAPAVASSVFMLAVLFASPASAQVATGTPPFGSFGGGPDVINLGDLNAHIVIPVFQKAGRGMSFVFNLSYDSSIWEPVGSSGSQSWQPSTGTNWGWTTSMPLGGHISYQQLTTERRCTSGWIVQTTYTEWAYYDGFGTPHYFSGSSQHTDDECTNQQTYTSFNSTAGDGSGYTISVTGGGINSLTAEDGAIISPYTGATTLQDRNGNRITSSTSSGTTTYTDTLGTTALTVSGAAPNPVTYTYTAPSGASASYTVIYTAQTVQTKFGCSGISEFGPTTEYLVDLPPQPAQ